MSLVKYIGPYRPGVTVTEADGSTVFAPYNETVLVSDTLEALLEQQPGMWEDGGDGSPVYTPPDPTANVAVRATVDGTDGPSPLVFDVTDDTKWAPVGGGVYAPTFAGIELGYAERASSNFVGTASVAKDVPSLAITITEGSRPYMVEMDIYSVIVSPAQVGYAQIVEGTTPDAGTVGILGTVLAINAGQGGGIRRGFRMPAGTPGTQRTFKVQILAGSTAVATLVSSAGAKSWIRAIEV